jgi:Transposase
VHLAHPLGVKAFEYRRVKNDVRDATDLADLLRMGRLQEAWIAPPATRELRELVRHRAKLVGLRSHCKAEVHAVPSIGEGLDGTNSGVLRVPFPGGAISFESQASSANESAWVVHGAEKVRIELRHLARSDVAASVDRGCATPDQSCCHTLTEETTGRKERLALSTLKESCAALAFRTRVRTYRRGMTDNLLTSDDWIPAACTLPTVEQPLRRAEFDALFAEDVTSVTQVSPEQMRFELRADPGAAARAADLAVRETGCCSFFTFDLSISDGRVAMTVTTSAAHAVVLAALRDRAATRVGGRG